MSWQVEYHDLTPPCEGCAIAVDDCAHIGETWLIRPLGADEWTPVIVADCAKRDDSDGTKTWMSENNIILELSYPLAVQFGAIDSIEVEVLK